MTRLRIAVVTPIFPTPAEPYRGAAIWSTLKELAGWADLDVFCTLPRYPARLGPRSFRYHREPVDASRYQLPSKTVTYFAIPWVTRFVNRAMITRLLRPAIEKARPDIILAYWLYPDGAAAVRVGSELGIPVVIGARGSDLRMLEGDVVARCGTRFAVSRAERVLCVSADLAQYARRYGAKAEKVKTIANGVDRSIFRPMQKRDCQQQLGVDSRKRIILFVGWLSELKGVRQLLLAFASLQRGNRDTQLALIGEGYLDQELRREASALGIADRVLFLGARTAGEIALWMNASDLLCLPSESEGCPNVIVEALSCGTPVAACAVGGIPELVDDESGTLIPDNHPELLARALDRVLERNWDREAIASARGRDWSRVAQETYNICVDAVSSYGKTHACRGDVLYEA